MADFPPSGVNPTYAFTLDPDDSAVLVTRFEDKTELRREKSTAKARRFAYRFALNATNMGTLLAFYRVRGTFTTFTATTHDPDSGESAEATVRFEAKPVGRWSGPNKWTAQVALVEVL